MRDEIVRLRDAGMIYQEIADKINQDYGTEHTDQSIRGIYRRAMATHRARPEYNLPEALKKGVTLETIADRADVSERVAKAMIDDLTEQGLCVDEMDGVYRVSTVPHGEVQTIRCDWRGDKIIRFGVVSDNHFGSHFTQISLLHEAYRFFKAEGIADVYNPGDLTEGENMRPGHAYECYIHGADAHTDEVIRNYPKVDGITTHCILGNHDASFVKHVGLDISRTIAKERPDMNFLGMDQAYIQLTPNCMLELRHPGGGSCFDDKTEILTKRGWISFENLANDDHVATMTKDDHCFEWQQPTHITKEPYSGIMYNFRARSVDMMVTPNHGMWAKISDARKNKKWGKKLDYPQKAHYKIDYSYRRYTAREMVSDYVRQKWQLVNACNDWRGITPSSDIEVPYIESKAKGLERFMKHIGAVPYLLMAKFMAWYVTEGYADYKRVSISQSKQVNPENHAEILSLLNEIGFAFNVGGRDCKDINIGSVELANFIVSQCGKGSADKHFPEWVKELPKEDLLAVFDILIKGDGWNNGKSYGYRSISPRLLDDVSEIAFKCGYGVTQHKDSISISTIQNKPTINLKPVSHLYNGKIYCCSVPNGLILVRRNGKATWSHNSYAISYKPQKIIESMSGGEKPNILLLGHFHKAEYLFYRNVHCIQAGTTQAQSNFMRNHNLAAHMGYWLIEIHVNDDGQVNRFRPEFMPCYRAIKDDWRGYR